MPRSWLILLRWSHRCREFYGACDAAVSITDGGGCRRSLRSEDDQRAPHGGFAR
jgi:hypothetical protein